MKTATLALAALIAASMIPADAVLAADKGLGPANPVALFLEDGLVGPGREYRSLALFPISLDGLLREFSATSLGAAAKEDAVALAERKPAGPPGSVQALGFGTETVLVLVGDLLTGGRLDRMITRDGAIWPKFQVALPATGVEERGAVRESRKTFDAPGLLAPPYLRMAVHRGDARRAIERLLDHYAPVLPNDAKTKSLAAMIESDRMRFLVSDYVQEFRRFPKDVGGPVIGVVAVVGDRIALFETFGSPALFRTHWRKILGSLAFAAAGHEIRTGVAGQPFLVLPAEGPQRFVARVSKLRKALAGAVVKARKAPGLEALYRIAGRTVVGSASAGPSGLIHLAAFPLRASDDAQYGRELPPEDVETVTPDVGELLRREEEGRLTEYEKRWLDRLRRRRERQGGSRSPGIKNPGGDPVLPGSGDPRRGTPGESPSTDKPEPPKPENELPPPGSGGGGSREDPILPPSDR